MLLSLCNDKLLLDRSKVAPTIKVQLKRLAIELNTLELRYTLVVKLRYYHTKVTTVFL